MEKATNVCPYCESKEIVSVISKNETHVIRGKEITTQIEALKCDRCGEEFSTLPIEEKNLRAFREQYRQSESYIHPDDIVQIRSKYGTSQKTLARILEFGELTINRYEQGALPSPIHNKILTMIKKNAFVFEEFYRSSKNKFSKFQKRKVDERLDCIIRGEVLKKGKYITVNFFKENVLASKYTGFIIPSIDKLIALIQMILLLAREALYKTSLLKTMFYCDFSYFRKASVSITGWEYARLPKGPVPDDYNFILNYALQESKIEIDNDEFGDLVALPKHVGYKKVAKVFDKDELMTVKEIVSKLSNKTAKQLVDMTHEEDAYKKTEHIRSISYIHALELKGV